MAKLQLQLNEQMMETMVHGSELFPAAYYVDVINENDFIPLHWHQEFELYYVIQGCVEVCVAGDIVILHEGEGLFINSNILHGFRHVLDSGICLCPNIVISPKLLFPARSILEQKYYHGFLLKENVSYMYLSPLCPWQKSILQKWDKIYSVFQILQTQNGYGDNKQLIYDHAIPASDDNELEIHILLLQFWKEIYQHKDYFVFNRTYDTNHSSHLRLQKMITFIQDNYQKNITLEAIAGSVNISRSEAGRCFRKYTFCSPIDYLVHYRINCAKQMLWETKAPVYVIAEKCGFSSVGYFGKMFKKITGLAPINYRMGKEA